MVTTVCHHELLVPVFLTSHTDSECAMFSLFTGEVGSPTLRKGPYPKRISSTSEETSYFRGLKAHVQSYRRPSPLSVYHVCIVYILPLSRYPRPRI